MNLDEKLQQLQKLYLESHKLEVELNEELIERFGENSYHFTSEINGALLITHDKTERQSYWNCKHFPISIEDINKNAQWG